MNDTTRTWVKDVLWIIVIGGFVASIIRFTSGLGAATGMNDSAPWGLWIAFKLVFVALAGGGFTLAGMVYIFHMEKYRPLLRRAILIALLGYGSFIVSLLFDLGLPWHIYMPILNWQHHSVMFEIAWCVILYFSVLNLEFAPVILEHPWFSHPFFKKAADWLHRLTLPLIIAGIVLSTLHQSSLGSLFLIMVQRVHPLWYSPWIPYMFFTSAIATGLMGLIVEGFLVEKWFGRKPHFNLLTSLGEWAMLPLGIYLILRLVDLWIRGVLPLAIDGSWQSVLFMAEILLGGVLPIVLLSIRKIRESREGLLTGATLAILGIMSQRMSLSIFTMLRAKGTSYIPSLGEILIAFAIPAAAALLYLFFAENLQLFDDKAEDSTADGSIPYAHQSWKHWGREVVARRSGFAVFVIALMVPTLTFKSNLPIKPVTAARGWDNLLIDGNKSSYRVQFPHLEHQERAVDERTGDQTYQSCHHLNRPEDEVTACWECHSDYYQPVSIFNHTTHQIILGGNKSCQDCHDQDHNKMTSAICRDCHDGMVPGEGRTEFSALAPAYKDALHGKCKACHEDKVYLEENPQLALCSTCHTHDQREADQKYATTTGR